MTPGAGMSGFAVASMNGRGTVLAVRVKKSDTEAFAKGKMNFDQFQQKAVINAYLGSATRGSGSWAGASYPGADNMTPVPVTR